MKKYLIIAAAALAASVACKKVAVDETPLTPVKFSVANYVPQTKAESVLSEFTAFKCKAFMHAEGVDIIGGADQGTFQNFFGADGETISANDATNATEWAPSHTYYWPKGTSSYVNFVGWYGTDGTNPVAPTVSYAYASSKWTATMTWSFTTPAVGQTGNNLLYADMAWRYKENVNPATYGVSSNVSEGVPMLFHHALAQINVKAYAESGSSPALTAGSGNVTDGIATWAITLKNVKITPVNKAGTLTLTNEDPGTNKTQAWTGDWSGTDTAGDFSAADYNVDKVTKATAGDFIAATCVLPQTLGASVVLSFDMQIVTSYAAGQTNTEVIPVSIKLNDMGTAAWEQNHKYTYYIKVVPNQNKVLFDPALDAAWIEGTTTDQTI